MGRVSPDGPRYSRTAVILHWTIAGLIINNLLMGWLCAHFEVAIEPVVMNAHKLLGLLVLLLSVVRLAWRLAHRPPPLASTGRVERWAAHGVHALLYGLMMTLPLSGWIVTSSFPGRHPISAGLFDIPFLPLQPNMATALPAHGAHSVLAVGMAVLVLGHALAALRHQFFLRDRTLDRMWIRCRNTTPDRAHSQTRA